MFAGELAPTGTLVDSSALGIASNPALREPAQPDGNKYDRVAI